jgi:hypothetical protein
VYISQLVKTRDLHPGLLSIAILFPLLLIQTAHLLPFIHLYSTLISPFLNIYHLSIVVEVLLCLLTRDLLWLHVTNLPCPSSKQVNDGSTVALKRHAHDFGDQQMTGNDDAGQSYLENTDKYKYDMLVIGRMITR